MNEALDRALDELVPRHDEPRRWDEVLGRAFIHTDRRRLISFAFAAGLAAVLIGAGGVFHREVVDFFSAEPAPEPIQLDFAKMGARARIELGPGRATAEAREVIAVLVDGKRRPLWVAPMESGGFCYRWHHFGSCGRMPQQDEFRRKLALGWLEGLHGPPYFAGHVLDPDINRLELQYADGQRIDLPYVWVSKPIDAGFTAFGVPDKQQRAGHGAVAVVAYSGDGREVERHVFPPRSDPQWEAAADGLPRIADRSKKRTLFDFRDETGAQWTLVVAPAPEEKLCYAYNRGGGCVSPRFPATPPAVIPGGKTIMVCCTVAEGVTKVELLFQDGRQIEVDPVDGFLLYELPSEQYRRGKRLEAIVSRNDSGQEVGRVDVKTDHPGIYPCKPSEELEYGYGQTVCP
jgi:hypothetical protein